MSDFFGFNTKLPGLGSDNAVPGNKYSNADEFLQPDDDIDLLNDETFGNIGDQGNSWEANHDRNADGFDDFLEEKNQEELVEQSINQLGIDDDEDSDGTNALESKVGKPIPGKPPINPDDIFGPASPPGLLDAEQLVSPSRRNIWRPSPPSSGSAPNEQVIMGLFPTSIRRSPPNTVYEDPAIVFSGKKLSKSLPNASPVINGPDKITPQKKPSVIMASDLEKSFKDERTPTPQKTAGPGTPLAPSTLFAMASGSQGQRRTSPPLEHNAPAFYGAGDGRASPIQMATPPGNRASPSPFHQRLMMGGRSPAQSVGNSPLLLPQNVVVKLYPHLLGTPYAKPTARGIIVDPRAINRSQPPPGMNGHGSPPMFNFLANSPIGPRPPMRPPYSDPQKLGMPPRPQQSLPQQQHQQPQLRLQHPSNQHHQGTQRRYDERRDNYYQRGYRTHGYQQHYNQRMNHKDDEYAGLMTQKEKDWIIKIQLLQLQTDNPYLDDYYYTTFTMKKMAYERKEKLENGLLPSGSTELRLLLPQIEKTDKVYIPTQFEGSLGRLTSASVHNPRQMIDAKVTSTDPEKETRASEKRQLLMYIEKMYDSLLEIDDIEKKALTLPKDAREPLYEARKTKIVQVFNSIICDKNGGDIFGYIMTIRKGKMLVKRALGLFDKMQKNILVNGIFRNLPYIIKKDQSDDVLPSLYAHVAQQIAQASIEDICQYTKNLMNAPVTANQIDALNVTFQNKFGISSIFAMVQQTEHIYVNFPLDVDTQSQNAWTSFLISVSNKLSSMDLKLLPKPLYNFVNISEHFERTLDRNSYLEIEDKINSLCLDDSS